MPSGISTAAMRHLCAAAWLYANVMAVEELLSRVSL
jgi:hypothetical protein